MGSKKKEVPCLRLERLNVQGFKAIKSSGLVGLHPLTLLIGRTGSGKSSLVEALQWLRGDRGDFENFLNAQSDGIKIQLKFTGDIPLSYDLVISKDSGDGRLSCSEALTREGEVGGLSKKDPAFLAVDTFIRSIRILPLHPDMGRFGHGLERPKGLPTLLASLPADQLQWVQERATRVFPNIGNFDVKKSGLAGGYVVASEKMGGTNGSRKVVHPSWRLSEGTLRVVELFTVLAATPRPSLLIVEGLENGLDPWALEMVFQELRDASTEGTQVIVTTHSPFLLDCAQVEEIVHVKRVDGHSTYCPISRYADVSKYSGVVGPGLMYISGYFDS